MNIDTTLDQVEQCCVPSSITMRGAHWAHKDEGRIQPSVFAAGPRVLGHTLGSLQRAPHGSIQLATVSDRIKPFSSDTSDGKR